MKLIYNFAPVELLPEDKYVLMPSQHGTFAVIELHASPVFKNNGFVIIPYINAGKERPQPLFFTTGKSTTYNLPQSIPKPSPLQLSTLTSEKKYLEHVRALRQEIQLGNIYEINYCIEFFAENAKIDPVNVFTRLNALSQAPYPMLVKLGDDYIISASPELFLRKEGDKLISKPIKGTAKRDPDPERDKTLKDNLYNSLKERTENVMAVDVTRNDLSQVARKGTVKVNKLYNIETFQTVHQMVSTVSCELKENTDFKKIISATFPMASMTGAPKISAMNLADEHEDFKRGFYSGTMGLIDAQGDFNLSVIIRSIFYNSRTKRLSLAVGGAITYLSEPETEYEECLLKANVLLKALNARIS